MDRLSQVVATDLHFCVCKPTKGCYFQLLFSRVLTFRHPASSHFHKLGLSDHAVDLAHAFLATWRLISLVLFERLPFRTKVLLFRLLAADLNGNV
jgi:hypothetical protein